MGHNNSASIYNIPLSAISLTTANAWDLFTITADSSARFELVKVQLQIASTLSALTHAIGLQLMRGSTAASTGAAVTPINIKGWTGALSASLTATQQSSTVISTASAVVLHAGAFDFNGTYCYEPEECERPVIAVSQRLNMRTTTPQNAASVHGTITVRELGKGLPT